MKKTIGIDLEQFVDHTTCVWVEGLVSLSKDYFSKVELIDSCLFLETEGDMSHKLTCLGEASSVDFEYRTYNCSMEQVLELFNDWQVAQSEANTLCNMAAS